MGEQTMQTMKCLSIRQPWASLIMGAGKQHNTTMFQLPKDVENRTWGTGYRGRILIHAAQSLDKDHDLFLAMVASDYLDGALPRGALLGTAEIVDCHQQRHSVDGAPPCCRSLWAVRVSGYWHWMLRNPVPFASPVPYKGRLGLFDVPASLIPTEQKETRDAVR